MCLRMFHSILFITILIGTAKQDMGVTKSLVKLHDWRLIESLAEEHPYIVALLNVTKEYICTGTIISKRAVLTSGSCMDPKPVYVAVGLAVVTKKSTSKSLMDVAYTKVHDDFTFLMSATAPNVTQMHSNIGLVFVVRSLLNAFLPSADIGSYYAAKLHDVELTAVGFGRKSETNTVLLQHQLYNQLPCGNPRWYYCICGIESHPSSIYTYEKEFGNGGPVLFGTEVVGIAVSSTGRLHSLSDENEKYNIFTVIGPYLPWIEKSTEGIVNTMMQAKVRATQVHNKHSSAETYKLRVTLIAWALHYIFKYLFFKLF